MISAIRKQDWPPRKQMMLPVPWRGVGLLFKAQLLMGVFSCRVTDVPAP